MTFSRPDFSHDCSILSCITWTLYSHMVFCCCDDEVYSRTWQFQALVANSMSCCFCCQSIGDFYPASLCIVWLFAQHVLWTCIRCTRTSIFARLGLYKMYARTIIFARLDLYKMYAHHHFRETMNVCSCVCVRTVLNVTYTCVHTYVQTQGVVPLYVTEVGLLCYACMCLFVFVAWTLRVCTVNPARWCMYVVYVCLNKAYVCRICMLEQGVCSQSFLRVNACVRMCAYVSKELAGIFCFSTIFLSSCFCTN